MPVLQGGVYAAQLVSDTDLTAATVTCTVTAPDGSTSTPVVTKTSPGATAPVPASQVGVYLIVWSSTGPVVGVVQDQFTCVAPQVDLISLPDLKDELQLAASYTDEDAKLRRWLKSATGVVENVTGPIVPKPTTEWFDGGNTYVVLSAQWVSRITSISEQAASGLQALTEQPVGAGVDGYGYTWDRATQVVTRRGQGSSPTPFAGGFGSVQVVYTAGLATIPDDVQLATAELVRHWRRKNDVSNRSSSSGTWNTSSADDMVMVGNYMVPNAVMELLEPWRRAPSVA